MNISLKGKRALVTGSSSGIGQAIALTLARAGARVVVNYRSSADGAAETEKRIKDGGGDAIVVQADVSKPKDVAALFQKIDDEWGGVDLVISNAGIDGERGLLWEIEPDDWTRVIEVNLMGAFHCAREATRRMVAQQSGVILFITSVHERIPWSGYSAYTAAKAGVSMLTKSLALELQDKGVRVLCVAPGAIKTDINKAVWDDKKQLADLQQKIPMGRMGTTDEIASVVTALVSDAGSYVTGTTLFVDGGMTDYPSFGHGG